MTTPIRPRDVGGMVAQDSSSASARTALADAASGVGVGLSSSPDPVAPGGTPGAAIAGFAEMDRRFPYGWSRVLPVEPARA